MKILVAVTGSIAAYRSPDLVKALIKEGHEVQVLVTRSAEKLVSRRSLSTFSGKKTLGNDVFDDSLAGTDHITWARWADAFVVYGATADFLARYAGGFAEDFLNLQLLATTSPVFLVPAMNPAMWEHAAVKKNTQLLAERGANFVGPIHGTVACEETGVGHVADISDIVGALAGAPLANQPAKQAGALPALKNKKVLISAGPMQSQLDPARLLQNRSSGLMGLELALAARSAGAEVTLMLGPVSEALASRARGFRLLPFVTAGDYESILMKEFPDCDVFMSVAAVLDFEFVSSAKKIERTALQGPEISLPIRAVPDFVARVARSKKAHQKVIAFAAETGSDKEIIERATRKLKDKQADALVANPVRQGLGPEASHNFLWILRGDQAPKTLGPGPKAELAAPLLETLFRD